MRRLIQFAFAASLLVGTASPSQAEQSFAIIYNVQKQDGGFNEAAFDGMTKVKAEFGIAVRQRVVSSVEKAEEALRAFAQRGVDNLLAIGFANTPAVKAVAKDFPETRFTLIDGVVEASNVKSILFREDHAGYLVGVAAGLKTESNRLGFLGGTSIPPVDRYGCGFVQGARAVNEAVAFDWRYIGDTSGAFRDENTATELASQMVSDGADIVFTAAGFAGGAALREVAGSDVFGIGVDVNQNHLVPGGILTSAVKRVDRAAYLSWKAAVEGTWDGGVTRLGVAENGVDWAVDAHNEAVVSDIQARVGAKRAALANGEITVQPPAAVAACGP